MPASAWRITIAACGAHGGRGDGGVELVGLGAPGGDERVDVGERFGHRRRPRAAAPDSSRCRRRARPGERGRPPWCPRVGLHRVGHAVHDVVVDARPSGRRGVFGCPHSVRCWSRCRRRAVRRRARRAATTCRARGARPGRAGTARRRARCVGVGSNGAHDHVLRNHRVGSTWSGASSGPRLWTVIRHTRSSGAALAYSTSTSK